MKNKKSKKTDFNFYWIYAGIALFFISLQLFNAVSNPIQKITKKQFFTDFLIENEVEKVTIVNNEFVEVFIKELKLGKEKHKKINTKNFNNPIKGPHYYFNITSGEQFENELKEFYKTNHFIESEHHIFPDVDTRKDVFGEMLGWLIPIIIMLFIWLYIMRRMSGGNSPASGIFNIGKSKATLFDKTRQTNHLFSGPRPFRSTTFLFLILSAQNFHLNPHRLENSFWLHRALRHKHV